MELRKLTGQKTYWHLMGAKRRPSVYEIASSRLLYYPELGFSVNTPSQSWYERYQSNSAFQSVDLEAFSDPRQTTYTSYTRLQSERETYVAELLDSVDGDTEAALPAWWLDIIEHVFAPLRYPCHGLMMTAAYLSSMAPGSRVTIAAAFQAADEIRRVHVLARRLHQLRVHRQAPGPDAKAVWMEHPDWQGARRLIEETMVVFDWSECFVKLNLALKPTFDHWFGHELAGRARDAGDAVTAQLLDSLGRDAQWHNEWSRELARLVLDQSPACRETMLEWIEPCASDVDAAIAPVGLLMESSKNVVNLAAQARSGFLASCGLEVPAK